MTSCLQQNKFNTEDFGSQVKDKNLWKNVKPKRGVYKGRSI